MLSRPVGGVMLNGTLVTPAIPLAVAVSVYPALTCAIERSLNVATPLTAGTTVVPATVPPVGFVPMLTVTTLVAPVTVLPDASSIATATTGPIVTPAVASLGPTVKPSCTALGPASSVQAPSTSAPAPTNLHLQIWVIRVPQSRRPSIARAANQLHGARL